ncbi:MULTISPECIES: DNA polymerase III subunit gamma/tau [Flavobacteriaceae]|uniref:DNA polymerase III subunit gamma/tau n=1 Tax=Flavobacteriaceae TaxID=49546 RepID=UPI0010AE9248|nr:MULTISPECIES: DNA polymerase III subunit gamma/tau [Flavobacteriaceae]NJB35040.1 DNA polymerase III subunit gamma/tau [Croceivirga sp. JEA036]TKD63423.1 DNA polymerase III subunit gamma/tau [Flavobacterium sp. ASW18X]
MEPFIVSARKYRPKTFKDVVGQQAITNTLENAIANNHLAQALLFCGPRGVGKTTCARILAKKINEDGTEREDEDFAFNIFELDAASNNSVDDIRNLIDQVRIPPQVGKYKVYIIDEVHMLSQSAFNAFLKTLEEPPKHAIFILATTEKHKIIPTILSRCQIFDFKRITIKDAADYLKYIAEEQGIAAEDDALHIIAQKADGAMRDALSIFDRVVSFSGKELTRKAVTENLNVLDYDTFFKTTDLMLANAIPDLLLLFNQTLSLGFDGHHFIAGLASHFRDLLVCQHPQTHSLLEVGEDAKTKYLEQAKKINRDVLLKGLDLANDCDLKYKGSKNQRLLVELTLMKLASLSFEGEKKKPDFIIPATHFRGQPFVKAPKSYSITDETVVNTTATSTSSAAAVPSSKTNVNQSIATSKVEKTPQEPIKPINLKNRVKRVSGLSLSSIKAKKEHLESKKGEEIDEKDLPQKPFTEEAMLAHWNFFVNKLENEGKKILSSNLQADTPRLRGTHTLWMELPNSTMKKEVEREQGPLIRYLREKLQNYSIELKIDVNEASAKKYAFTPQEKFEKLREKNPAIDILRKEFDLDF